VIRDLDSGSKIGKKSGSGIQDEHPRLFTESLETVFRAKKFQFFYGDPDLGSLSCCCCWIRDPGSGKDKNQIPGSGINIPDPQHW
jgi:hypothetical protein